MGDAAEAGPKVLIVAPNASSRFGGEAFLPLRHFEFLRARGVPATLLVHARNRDDLGRRLAAHAGDIVYLEDTWLHRMLWRLGRALPRRLAEALVMPALTLVTEIDLRRPVRALVKAGRAEVIHQPIPVSPRAPSAIWGMGVPVVIGPMNGAMTYPPGYEDHPGAPAARFVGLARGLAVALNRLLPGKRRAAALLVANPRTRAALPVAGHARVIEMVENGVDLSTFAPPEGRPPRLPDAPFRLVFMGRLVALKGLDFGLRALAMARAAGADIGLDILGDGDDRARLEAIAAAEGVAGAVRFLGFLPQDGCAAVLAGADALILPSLQECGGAVVLEAMAMGLPVIASDWGGPADYLDRGCGLLVHPVPRDSFAARLAEAMLALWRDPAAARSMGAAGARKVRAEFDWERKADRMLELYRDLLGRGPPPLPPP
ncbi:MAG: glycosyltransferase family 4 protein [Rhodobacteraceae bacterium]|jgi:glycosyltransferase involved in cell wall biosynthesis|nr:glycosyltransferase family 4 protein [Paracoccaceae bacterium]